MDNDIKKFPTPLEITGAALAVIPFLCNIGTSSTRTVNGVIIEEHHTNYVALVLGPVAILCGLAALPLLRHSAADELTRRKVGIAMILLAGAWQII